MSISVYASPGGRSPVEDWLLSLPEDQQDECIAVMRRLRAEGSNLRWPTSKPVGNGFFELSDRLENVQIRLIYFFGKGSIAFVAAGFIKQGPRGLDAALKLDERRRTDILSDPARYTRAFDEDELRAVRKGRGHP